MPTSPRKLRCQTVTGQTLEGQTTDATHEADALLRDGHYLFGVIERGENGFYKLTQGASSYTLDAVECQLARFNLTPEFREILATGGLLARLRPPEQ